MSSGFGYYRDDSSDYEEEAALPSSSLEQPPETRPAYPLKPGFYTRCKSILPAGKSFSSPVASKSRRKAVNAVGNHSAGRCLAWSPTRGLSWMPGLNHGIYVARGHEKRPDPERHDGVHSIKPTPERRPRNNPFGCGPDWSLRRSQRRWVGPVGGTLQPLPRH